MSSTAEIAKEQMHAYKEAVKSGLYAKKSGLVGKYDNVRRYWEDEITRQFLRPHLQKLLKRNESRVKRLRILDLGCGSLGLYKGIDLSPDLLRQARETHDNPKMVFEQADFTQGLPLAENERPYDLYFTSYGTCSHHNEDETLVRLLAEIAGRTEEYCIIACDWLGRYSYEWQSLWTNDLSENRNMDYVISYIYEEEEREARRDELEHLLLRLVSRKEAENIVEEASKCAGVRINPLVYFDRSVFTGRHMDTAEYNPYAQPIRQGVNSLHEANMRTDLDEVIINYIPKPGFDFLNDYFEHLALCWNTLVQYTRQLLEKYDEAQESFATELPPVPAGYPPALQDMMKRMRHVVEGIGWLGIGLPRENIIEPQLGYALRYMMTNLQQGLGCAHGLVGIFEVDKQ